MSHGLSERGLTLWGRCVPLDTILFSFCFHKSERWYWCLCFGELETLFIRSVCVVIWVCFQELHCYTNTLCGGQLIRPYWKEKGNSIGADWGGHSRLPPTDSISVGVCVCACTAYCRVTSLFYSVYLWNSSLSASYGSLLGLLWFEANMIWHSQPVLVLSICK